MDSIVVVAAVVIALTGCVAVGYRAWQGGVQKKVLSSSQRLTDLRQINIGFSGKFYNIRSSQVFHFDVDSKQKFDSFNPSSKLIAVLGDDPQYYREWLDQASRNQRLWYDYQRQVLSVGPSTFQKKTHKEAERLLFEKTQLKKPVTAPVVTVAWSYTSPQGQNSYECSETFECIVLQDMLDGLDKASSRQAQIAKERSLVTEKVRYRVMERDGFRCVLCGSSVSDGVQLHVDHIFPVSKGGKSTMDNLRTLCDRCNLGKGDHVELS